MIDIRQSAPDLPHWTEQLPKAPVAPFSRYRLFAAKDTPFHVDEQSWRGLPVVDRRGQEIGRVADLLIEARSLDESALDAGSGHAWGVRAVYAVVECGRRWPWSRRRQVFIPRSKLEFEANCLISDELATDIRLTLFSRV
jgi:hypothetical protein